jgi:hypothetical protein
MADCKANLLERSNPMREWISIFAYLGETVSPPSFEGPTQEPPEKRRIAEEGIALSTVD